MRFILLGLAFLISLQVPNYVYTYKTVLSGQMIELTRDYTTFQRNAEIRGMDLGQYFKAALQQAKMHGKDSISYELVEYNRAKIDRYLSHYNQMVILEGSEPLKMIPMIFQYQEDFRDTNIAAWGDLKMMSISFQHNTNWWMLIMLMTICIMYILVNIFDLIKALLPSRKKAPAWYIGADYLHFFLTKYLLEAVVEKYVFKAIQ